ncbi:MAG TPA: tetratricopeptide repeat protein [Candidatus Binatia bacterium]|nr:tetratricopeptide repeat protein [Candidatus Binatia bacterium]
MNADRTAFCWAALGQIAEDEENWNAAVSHYLKGLAIAPSDSTTAYFLNNNAGHCLNRLGRYSEAERYCRRAIEINPKLHYAYKNLGISLQGQGDVVGAAWVWIDATKANRADPRAFFLLEKLVHDRPDLLANCRWITQQFSEPRS